MIITILAILIGILLIGFSLYYLTTERNDSESKKIYTVTLLAGLLLTVGTCLKLFLF